MARLRPRLSYSNVIATLALFLALGGGAYALSRNDVKSRNIAPDAVRGADVQESTLRGVGAGLLGGEVALPNGSYSGTYSVFGGGAFGDPATRAMAPVDFRATKLRVRLFDPVSTGTRRFLFNVNDEDTKLCAPSGPAPRPATAAMQCSCGEAPDSPCEPLAAIRPSGATRARSASVR